MTKFELLSEDEHNNASLTPHFFNVILQIGEILNSIRNWSQLAFLEA